MRAFRQEPLIGNSGIKPANYLFKKFQASQVDCACSLYDNTCDEHHIAPSATHLAQCPRCKANQLKGMFMKSIASTATSLLLARTKACRGSLLTLTVLTAALGPCLVQAQTTPCG